MFCLQQHKFYKHLVTTRDRENPRKFPRNNKFHMKINSSISILAQLWDIDNISICCCSWCYWFTWGRFKKVIIFQHLVFHTCFPIGKCFSMSKSQFYSRILCLELMTVVAYQCCMFWKWMYSETSQHTPVSKSNKAQSHLSPNHS